jgi:hypothetical protein
MKRNFTELWNVMNYRSKEKKGRWRNFVDSKVLLKFYRFLVGWVYSQNYISIFLVVMGANPLFSLTCTPWSMLEVTFEAIL